MRIGQILKKTALVFLVVVLISPLSSQAASKKDKPIKLTFTHGFSQVGFMQVYFEEWGKKLELLTDGKVKLEVYPMNTFCSPVDLHDALVNGIIDIAHDFLGYYSGRFPMIEVLDLPLGPWTESQLKGAYIGQKLIENGYFQDEFDDLKLLWWACGPPEQIQTRSKVETLEDFKGLRIRKPGIIGAKFVEALGASVVSMSASDVYLALEKGTIDGMPYGTGDMLTYKTDEVTKHTTDLAFGITNQPIFMNLAKWNSLPPDVQEVFTKLSGMNGLYDCNVAWKKWNDRMAAQVLSRPGRLVNISSDEVKKMNNAVKPVWEWWVKDREEKGLPAQKTLDAALSYAKEYDAIFGKK